jgi:hypothetical protein
MERQPYYQPSESGNKDSKDKKTSGGFNAASSPTFQPAERTPEPVRTEPRHIPIAPAFEGVISWREQADDMIRQGEERHRQEEAKENTEVRVEGEQGKSKEKDTSKKEQPKQQPIPFGPLQEVSTPRPVNEVIAEETEAQKDTQGGEDQPAAAAMHPQVNPVPFRAPEFSRNEQDQSDRRPVQTSAPTNYPAFGAFPTLTDRAPEVPQPRSEASAEEPAEYQPPVQQGEYQAYTSPENEDQSQDPAETDPNQQTPYGYAAHQVHAPQPTFNQAPPAPATGFNPNVNPFMPTPAANTQPNLSPANPNLPPLSGNGNMGGNVPPAQPGFGFNSDPSDPYHPAYSGGGEAASHESTPIMPIERPGLPQNNRDPRVGPVAALLGLEYFARKRADRKLEKRVNKRSDERFKKHEQQMTADHRRLQEQQQDFNVEQQRQTREMQRMRYQETAPQSVTDALRSTSNLPQPFESAPNRFGAAEHAPAQPRMAANEVRPMQSEFMQQPKPAAELAVQQAAQEAEEQQALQIGPHEHVAHSAWHNIVVDEKGREVVGAIQYGEGFQRERQQESIRDNFGSDSQTGGGTSAQVTGGGYTQDQFGSPMLPSGMTNPTLPPGHSTHVDPQHQLPATNKQQSNITNPWFWIMLILIIAAFFTAALV